MNTITDRDLLTEVCPYRSDAAGFVNRFTEWLELLTEDIRYVMPTFPLRAGRLRGFEQRDRAGETESAYFDDDRCIFVLARRPASPQYLAGGAVAPPDRQTFLAHQGAAPDELAVRSNFLLYRHRLQDEVEIFAGHREDVLRRVGGELKIARRTIILAANILPGKNLSVFF